MWNLIILFIRNNIQYGLQKWCKPNAIELARIAEVQPTSAIRCKITENLADQRRIYLKILFEFDNDIAVDPKRPFRGNSNQPKAALSVLMRSINACYDISIALLTILMLVRA